MSDIMNKHFRWMPGMQVDLMFDADDMEPDGGLVLYPTDDGANVLNDDGDEREYPSHRMRPNTNSHSTVGIIEHGLLPKAWAGKMIRVERFPFGMGHRVKVLTSDEENTLWDSGYVDSTHLGQTLMECLEAAP